MLAVAPAGDGAPLTDIALVGGIISAATVAVLAIIVAYRRGGAKPVRLAGDVAEWAVKVPGWAAIPGLLAIGAAVITFMGAIWDIGVHIDEGRDNGPFGTTAHYPMLVGLVGVYLCGVLAVGLAPTRPEDASRSAVHIRGLGPVPAGALLILIGGGYAMLGFPLDDFWHRLFGQDVTLWGPTHTMFFGGLIAAASGAVILMAEGARAVGRNPFGHWTRKPLIGVLGGVFLFVATHATDEFNWGLPQYRQVWQPIVLAAFGAFGLIAARSLGGRGATMGALLAYLPLQFIEVLMIGALGTTRPASILFVAEALVVEALMWRRSGLKAAAIAGLGVGTLGFAAEYGWSHVAAPLPWHPALLPEGIPAAALAGVAGGTLAALFAAALTGAAPRRGLVAALAAAAALVGLGINAGISSEPSATATLSLTDVRDGTADVSVRLSDPGLGRDGNWAYVLGWQGGGRFHTRLVPQADGSLRAADRVPIGGSWKTFARFHKGRALVAAPIRMPADPAVKFAGYAAEPQVTRPLQRDTKLLQIERKEDGPLWAWKPAMLIVMVMNLTLIASVGATAVRVGRAHRASLERDPVPV